MASQDSILILGIGNLLWADEGFGVRCVEALNAAWALPANVTVLDGGTQGLYLLPFVTEARHLLVFDAVDYGLPPGTMKRVEGDEVPQFLGAKKMSLHQTGFQEVLASARMLDRFPESLLLIGVQPVELEDFGGSLRPEVAAQVPEAVAIALSWLRARGVEPVLRKHREVSRSALALAAYEDGRPAEQDACRIGDVRFFPEAN
ncbi:HyaD/HybD family hydrogenase maturation endopeptidase [Denitromonas ohlonensis]|uniref:HyaD/HybD family hydrogenase maturation endopeptidase n=2 Tax=Denitromonas TaxID=139331 RepID=A0A557RUC7_9RHOO|nr:HyaD/HybD family hydrogenase maturation endopeptidase [Denitromonas ohlonensis]TVO68765.1 HyaD/HybD family hydrogenase maturation endopeptidase [Denitromonas ohlonensis]TVO72869.1 HyaD/HybD family hydrogenase maturation endopeptidase [Denitromonas ohlonensis]TVT49548.1 MAG: HyaD/HybD family hydrogenase maturation endopeptidase [Denitromonas halophila]TVT75300.1 MAG: HyaD/HybD family hydrogenase maturation endopeptidase [Denitromonas halophila]